jgi:hypothetical protein
MILPIDDKCRVRGTEMCWQLERLKTYKTGKKAGTVEWTPYKYFGTLESALSEALQREIRTHPAATIPEAIEAVKTALAKYTAIFDQSVK